MLTRFEDWPEQLLAFVRSRETAPFAWGANDCCSFGADAVLAETGTDLMADLRGRYSTAAGAARVTAKMGGIAAFLDVRLARTEPGLARRGDLVMFETVEGPALGVVVGARAAAAGPDGIIWVPSARWQQAWRVG